MSGNLEKYIIDVIKKASNKALSSSNMKSIANEAAQDIKRRTRLGYGVEKHAAKRKKLEALSELSVAIRKNQVKIIQFKNGEIRFVLNKSNARRHPNLHSETSPKKSNLTFTGQMLNSIRARTSQGKIEIYLIDKRIDGESNNEIAKKNSIARPFLNLSNRELQRVEDKIIKNITKEITKVLK